MDEDKVRAIIATNFPDLIIDAIKKIGEGTGNVAYEVNTDLIFRFPKKSENQEQLEYEIAIQEVLKKYASLPTPNFTFMVQDHSFVGYKKLLGTSMLNIYKQFKNWDNFSQQIGSFLSSLHTIPKEEINDLRIPTEVRSFTSWQNLGRTFYEKTKHKVPSQFHHSVKEFLSSRPPQSNVSVALCHNDLGIEHILLTEGKVTGIIDWGGTALTDSACDFARIYRDLGEVILNKVLAEYTVTQVKKDEIRERAIFYGKCLLFEDLFYGMEQELYLEKCLRAFGWMF